MNTKQFALSSVRLLMIILFLSVFFIFAGGLSLPSQKYAGWILLGLFLILRIWKKSDTSKFLHLFLVFLGAFITARYLVFRTAYTLTTENTVAFVFSFILYAAEIFASLLHFLGLFVTASPVSRKIVPEPETLPEIDVFITTYKESPEVALYTAIACSNFDYPKDKLNIYILDEGSRLDFINDAATKEAALSRYHYFHEQGEKYGFKHLIRAVPHHAKAGLFNDAFQGKCFEEIKQVNQNEYSAGSPFKTSGNLILILDCDHVPTRDFLKNTVGFFGDEKLFLVQTPHFMVNPDPVQRNLDYKHKLPPESWLFYFSIQKGLDSWNGTFLCGSAAVLRRKALAEIGGLSGETLTEDAETSVALHSRGWKSIYLDKPMISGLEPENMDGLIGQRRRWCQGMIQILILKCPLFKKGLSLAQRLCYLNSSFFWLFPLARTVFLLAPLMFLLFQIDIYNASFGQVINFAFPHIFASILLADYLFGKYRPFLMSEVLESLQGLFLLPSLLLVFLSPRKPKFLQTPKGIVMDKEHLAVNHVSLYVLIGVMLLGCVRAVYLWHNYPLLHEAVGLTAFWNLFNLLVVCIGFGALWELKQRRENHRYQGFSRPASINGVSGKISDISIGGACVLLDELNKGSVENAVFKSGEFETSFKVTRTEGNTVAGVFIGDNLKERINFVCGDSSVLEKTLQSRLNKSRFSFRLSGYLVRIGFRGMFRHLKNVVKNVFQIFLFGFLVQGAFAVPARAETINIPLTTWTYADSEKINTRYGFYKIFVHVPERWVLKKVVLDLSYSNSDNILPPDSQIELYMNDRQFNQIPLYPETPKGVRSVEIPSNNIVSGDNELRLAVLQYSDTQQCNDGNFWTSFDFEKSALRFEYEMKPLSVQDSTDFEMLYDAHSFLTYKANFVVPEKNEENLKNAAIAGAKLALFAGKRPMMLAVSGEPVSDMDNYTVGTAAPGFKEGEKYLFINAAEIPSPEKKSGTVLIEPLKSYTFSDLGAENITFRRTRRNGRIDFRIPSTTYLSPNEKMKINLDIAYGSEISSDTVLTVLMNGKVLAYLPLANLKGEMLDSYTLEILMSLLKKGLNTISFELDLKPKNKETCVDVRNQNLFLTVFSSSSLSFPDTGKYYTLPDLSLFFNDGYPFDGSGVFYIGKPTDRDASAFVNLIAMTAQRRGTVPHKLFVSSKEEETKGRNFSYFQIKEIGLDELLTVTERPSLTAKGKISLEIAAATPENLESGMERLWNLKGVSGNVLSVSKDESFHSFWTMEPTIYTNIGLWSGLDFYASNYKNLFLFSGIVFLVLITGGALFLLDRRKE